MPWKSKARLLDLWFHLFWTEYFLLDDQAIRSQWEFMAAAVHKSAWNNVVAKEFQFLMVFAVHFFLLDNMFVEFFFWAPIKLQGCQNLIWILVFMFGDFSDGIVMWVKKKTGPAIDFVKSESDAEELLLQVDTPLAVAFLENFEVDESSAQMEHNNWRRRE